MIKADTISPKVNGLMSIPFLVQVVESMAELSTFMAYVNATLDRNVGEELGVDTPRYLIELVRQL